MSPIEAEQICQSAEQALRHGSSRLANFPGLLRRIIKQELWKSRQVPGHGVVKLQNLRELIVSKPRKGWGEDPTKIEAVIRDDPEVLSMWREAMKGQEGGDTSTGNIITSGRITGTSRAYLISRLEREAPDLWELVKAKKLKPHKAAVQAGFCKPTRSIPIDSASAAIAALLRVFSRQELESALFEVIERPNRKRA